MNPENIKISVFPNIKTPSHGKQINLHQWLTNDRYEPIQARIRSLSSEPQQKKLKGTLPVATMSGVCTYRKAEILQHNGFVCIDIDRKDNAELFSIHTPDILKTLISKLSFVYLCAESVRGGLYCLVQIADPSKHKEYYSQIAKRFKDIDVNVDKACSDTARARIYSYDANYLLNKDAAIFNELPEPITFHKPVQRVATTDTETLFLRCLKQIETYQIDITSNRTDWIKIASAIASEFGSSGVGYFRRISQFYPNYKPNEAERTYLQIAKNPKCSIATFYNICLDYGISYLI